MDLVVPVPLYRHRFNWRGFNQAEEIARCVSERLGVDYANVLLRTRNTKQQARLKDRKERFENIRGAFVVKKMLRDGFVRDKRVLLVDDVWTSGATMRECGRVLRKAGAGRVGYFVLAR